MKNKIGFLLNKFSLGPDWMLKREIFVVILFIPVLYFFLMTVFTVKSLDKLGYLEQESLFLESLLSQREERNVVAGNNIEDKDYMKNILEKISFLSKDRKQLAMLCSQVSEDILYPGIKERLCFLESEKNKLVFKKIVKEDEIIWRLKTPVQMSIMDVKRVVSLVEGRALGLFYPNPARPNLRFSKINIKDIKKSTSEVYSVDFEVIQKR